MEINRIYQGNALSILKKLPDESIDMCITSPPYFNLRTYETEPFIWDGEEDCNHDWNEIVASPKGGKNHPDRPSSVGGNRHMSETAIRGEKQISNFCSKCKAWKGSLGLEPTPELYIQHLVQIFHEVSRILKPSGTLWVNIGDSYATVSGTMGGDMKYKHLNGHHGIHEATDFKQPNLKDLGYKHKDIIGIPWMLAFALRADGWYLRQDIIWAKPNPMPESVKDRFTKSHEYIFLLSKSKEYYFDQDSVKEPCSSDSILEYKSRKKMNNKGDHGGFRTDLARSREDYMPKDFRRNKRSVWTINLKPFKDAHFAVFPKELIISPIKAGCPKGGIILDPFFGSGTTGEVARELERNYIGIELNPNYIEIANKRLDNIKPTGVFK